MTSISFQCSKTIPLLKFDSHLPVVYLSHCDNKQKILQSSFYLSVFLIHKAVIPNAYKGRRKCYILKIPIHSTIKGTSSKTFLTDSTCAIMQCFSKMQSINLTKITATVPHHLQNSIFLFNFQLNVLQKTWYQKFHDCFLIYC